MRIRTLSVTEVTQYLKRIVTNDPILSHVSIEGEISNLKCHSSGHIYFTLKDELARIQCVMFYGDAQNLKFMPEDGQHIMAKGGISIYEKEGRYQIYVKSMEIAGLGDLHMRFEALKAKLEALGYFRMDKKKPIPKYVTRLGVITSADGAAWRDIHAVLTRRCKMLDVFLYPVPVQGTGAAEEITSALEVLDKKGLDVILLARGGGSIEELWSFNEELLAKAVFNAKTPIITGVGHETDFTIVDFVADFRASTPSAAAEVAVVDHQTLQNQLTVLMQSITVNSSRIITDASDKLSRFKPETYTTMMDLYIKNKKMDMDYIFDRNETNLQRKITELRHQLELAGHQLNGLSPLGLLSKGYGIVENANGLRIKRCSDIEIGEDLTIRIEDGSLQCKVEKIERSSLNENEKG